jgi:hypothetical protein
MTRVLPVRHAPAGFVNQEPRTLPAAIRARLAALLRSKLNNSGRVRMRRMKCPRCGQYAWITVGPRKAAAETAFAPCCWVNTRKAP